MTATRPAGPDDSQILRVGAPMWSLPSWVGRITPQGTKRSEDLNWYATWCNAVEGNTSFYAVPSESAVARWAELAPQNFRFCFKLPRSITHERRLSGSADLLSEFLTRLSPLRCRLGPIWIQLPASFGPDHLATLRAFLASLSAEFCWSVELRNPAFEAEGSSERAANDLLFDAGVDRTIFDSRALFAGPCVTEAEQDGWRKKPLLRVRPVALGEHPTIRFIGQTAPEANPRFWAPWVDKVAQWVAEGRQPYVFIHTPDNAKAPYLARQFHAEVAALAPLLRPLSHPRPVTGQRPLFPEQSS